MQASGRFSPDGRWVVFSGWHQGESARQILIVPVTADGNVAAQQVVEVTSDSATNLEPVWSPGGNRIYYLSNRDGHQCVWARDVDPRTAKPAGAVFEVAHFHRTARKLLGPAANASAIGLSAARDFLILTLTDTKSSIWSRADR
jgi:hypothetical protein